MNRLDELTKTMDLPEQRRRDWFWLIRNMWIRNRDHPNFEEAYQIVKEEYKKSMK